MEKNLINYSTWYSTMLKRGILVMKLTSFLLLAFILNVSADVYSQDVKVNLDLNKTKLEDAFKQIRDQTNYDFFYNKEDLDIRKKVSGTFVNETLGKVMMLILGDRYDIEYKRDIILITPKEKQDKKKNIIRGKVTDNKGNPLPGVSVVIKGTTVGVATSVNGNFIISASVKDVLEISFIGMETKFVTIKDKKSLTIVLNEARKALNEVVANGYFKRSKETFTGASTSVTGDQIKAISNTNLIQALAALTPGMHIVENNAQGSNPNAIPQIIIRGTTSLISGDNQGANAPLIVLDGVEITMEELYDLEIEDIDRIDVLKDAAATSIYGDTAANGVIVVTRKRVKDPKLRVRYNFTPNYSIPDIRSINLTNAEQKLELERLAGLYDDESGKFDMAYKRKLMDIKNGVNTDWISKPLRMSFSQNHALSLSGRANLISYRVSANFRDSYGVMKDDNRNNYGFNVYLGYFKSKKLRVNFRCGFSLLNSTNSPYGDFSQYTTLNPYNPVRDEYGRYIKKYYFNPYDKSHSSIQGNPLYNASLSSFDKNKSMNITNSLDARWEVNKDLIVTSQLSYNTNFSQVDKYTSPDDSKFIDNIYLKDRGEYRVNGRNGYSFSAKLGLNYRILFDEGSAIRINAGGQIKKNKSDSHTAIGEGFKKDWMSDLRFAMMSTSTGMETISSSVGVYGSVNMSYRQRYNFDLNVRTSGSSKYGDENKWGPFWSGGVSWNLHKESFLDYTWLNSLRIKASTGYTGSSNFDPYQAITVYQYSDNLNQYTGIGAIPKSMGNPQLKWQKTLNTNYGLSASVLDNRLSFGLDYFVQNTKDVIMNVSVPPSLGTNSVRVNYGEIQNSGYDINISGQIIRSNDVYWSVSVTGSHVVDELKKLSKDVLKQNIDETINTQEEPNLLLLEGGSQYDIYGVKSAGIDPATGKEIFIDRNGNYTFEYNILDKVALGNTNPTFRGSINTGFSYKNFSVNVTSNYTFGADKYNSTIYHKVENIDPYGNVDERAFTDRWKNPGDLKRFLGIQQAAVADDNRHTSRFVEKFNELYISNVNFAYEFKPEFLKKWGIKRLKIGYGMSDVVRFSSMKYERGTSYPYCRTFNISIKPTF